MSARHTPAEPETSFEFIAEWFDRARKRANAQGKRDSAQMWRDGLEHLTHFNDERDRLKAANAELAAALEALVNDGSPDCIPHKKWVKASAALAKHKGETA